MPKSNLPLKICPFQSANKNQLNVCSLENCALYDEIWKKCSLRVLAVALYRATKKVRKEVSKNETSS